jgi:hypothetical protein
VAGFEVSLLTYTAGYLRVEKKRASKLATTGSDELFQYWPYLHGLNKTNKNKNKKRKKKHKNKKILLTLTNLFRTKVIDRALIFTIESSAHTMSLFIPLDEVYYERITELRSRCKGKWEKTVLEHKIVLFPPFYYQ